MKRTCLCALAAGMAWCTAAVAKPPLEKIGPGVRVDPINIAKVKRVNGQIVLDGEWIPYTGGFGTRGPRVDAPFFDCFGRVGALAQFPGPGSQCVPACDTAPDIGARWYFGSAYHNPNTVDDMQDCACPPGSVIDEVDLAWFWAVPVASPCFIIFYPFEDSVYEDGYEYCNDPAFMTGTGGGGVVLDFTGLLSGDSYYWSAVTDLGSLGVLSPSTDDNGNSLADGSYQMIIASSVTSTGYTLADGPTQPMLWGTGDSTGECRPGHNAVDSFDDDAPTNGVLDWWECYDYTFGVCPDPLGKCNAFCYLRCPADFSNDGFVDGIDYDIFSNDFEAGSKCADLNGDCFVDGIDADLFYNDFEAPC